MEDTNKDWRTTVSKNLVELVSCTVMSSEMVILLLHYGLITFSERDLLFNQSKSNVELAAYLYTNIARRSDDRGFESLKLSLRETGNSRALQILTDGSLHSNLSSRASNHPLPVKDTKEKETQNTPVLPCETQTPKYTSNSVILSVDSKDHPSQVVQDTPVLQTNDEILKKMEQLEALVVQYVSIGRYHIAAPLCEQAIKDLERDCSPNHLGVATLLDLLASVYKNQIKEESEVKNVLKYALSIRDRTREEIAREKPQTTSIRKFGTKTINFRDVTALYKRALQIRKNAHKDDHLDVGASLENLAGYYAEQQKFQDAEQLYKEALQIKIKALGDSSDVGISLMNLATVYKQLKKYEEAETSYKWAFEIYKKRFGNDHPLVATCLNYLGLLYADQGIYVDTVHIYKRALAIRRKKLGNDHLDVAEVLNNLASAYKERKKYEHSELMFKEAIKIREVSLMPDHPDLATSLIGLADLYMMREKYLPAETFYKRSLNIREKCFGPEHSQVADLLVSIADIYLKKCCNEEAHLIYLRALKITEKQFGYDHQQVKPLLTKIASLHEQQAEQEDTM